MESDHHAIKNARAWLAEIRERVAELEAAASGTDAEDEIREQITESVLAITVRSGWHSPGERADPEEYQILLSTGGPALRIIGELTRDGPDEFPSLQWQDWGVPWTNYRLDEDETRDVATFARCFYFGEN